MDGQPWREASSLIIASHVNNLNDEPSTSNSSSSGSTTDTQPMATNLIEDYKLLMTKRSAKASFLASAFVFPGGHLEESDFSPKWWSVFFNSGFTRQDVLGVVNRIHGPRPPMVVDNQKRLTVMSSVEQQSGTEIAGEDILPADIALRICAIRETFEEAGILLIERMNIGTQSFAPLDSVELDKWRIEVRENSDSFADLCLQLKCSPNIWELREWWNWLTPNALGHKRFDTMFYLYCSENQLDAISDGKEVSQIEWYSPRELLQLHQNRKAFLAPPQVYELSRLAHFSQYNRLQEFSISREPLGCQRWRPVMTGYQDGTALLLPGDDMYTRNSSGKESENVNIRSMPTLEEARSQTVHFNRIELRVPVLEAHCNIQLACGHASPPYPVPVQPVLRSSL
ncbi:acyl-coenzyme A diphosphatase NUDT19-like [Brevipalpus obovatus]|uniref:acyl-coenzyme A diphosphatase NUDT19-like n=1 Tax=Brevipalpus obovatus TaxID=246614 RepID=UPI003D9E3594